MYENNKDPCKKKCTSHNDNDKVENNVDSHKISNEDGSCNDDDDSHNCNAKLASNDEPHTRDVD